MPTMRDFRSQQETRKKTRTPDPKKTRARVLAQDAEGTASPKRRPGREKELNNDNMENSMSSENQRKQETPKDQAVRETAELKPEDVAYFEAEAEAQAERDTPKIEIQFKGSELLRSRFPKPFDLAEAVATDWSRDGRFENLPISHPLAQWAAQRGLLKAKEIEKKVMESPALEKAAVKALTVGMQAQGFLNRVRGHLKR